MTLVVTVAHSAADQPRLRINVASSASAPLPVVDGSTLILYRVHEDGTRYRVITEVGARLISGGWSGFDYHAPFNVPVQYVAQASGQESAVSATQYLLSDSTWLIHPSIPALAVRVDDISKIGDRARKSQAAAFDVFDGPTVFIKGPGRKGISSTIEVRYTPDNESLIMDLLEDDSPILINTPGAVGWDLKWIWVQPRDENYTNPAGLVKYPYRRVEFGITETTQPDVDLSPIWNYGTIDATYATYAAIDTAYTTYGNLALDIR